VRSIPLDLITAIEVEELWQRGTDTPFWFQDDFAKAVKFSRSLDQLRVTIRGRQIMSALLTNSRHWG